MTDTAIWEGRLSWIDSYSPDFFTDCNDHMETKFFKSTKTT